MIKGLEALENIKIDMEYVTRLDFVEPVVRGEVQQSLYKIYHRETPELETIEKELKAFEIIKETFKITFDDEELTIGIDNVYFLSFKDKTKYDLLKEVLYEKGN